MAFSSTIFILFSLAAASTIAHSLAPPDTVAQVTVVGRLLCTATGNPESGISNAPVVMANVTLSCNGGETYLGQALTDLSGFYQVVLSTADALLFDDADCAIFIPLPAGNCTLLPPTGTLRAPLIIIPGIGRSLGVFSAGVYVRF